MSGPDPQIYTAQYMPYLSYLFNGTGHGSDRYRILVRGKLEVAGNEGHEQAGKANRAVVPL